MSPFSERGAAFAPLQPHTKESHNQRNQGVASSIFAFFRDLTDILLISI